MNHRTLAALIVSGCMHASLAHAQIGPSPARIVDAGMPDPGYPDRMDEDRRIIVTIPVGPDGRAKNVQLSISSGDATYDERMRSKLMKLKVLPALDASGTPIEGEIHFAVSLRKGSYPHNEFHSLFGDLESPTDNTFNTPALTGDQLRSEVSRITHMRCRDFVWEYDLMKDIAGSRPIVNEVMPRTLLAMFMVYAKTNGPQAARLGTEFPFALRTSARQCREHPEVAFFTDGFVPAMQARLH